jgi:hypothetical protein
MFVAFSSQNIVCFSGKHLYNFVKTIQAVQYITYLPIQIEENFVGVCKQKTFTSEI